MYVVNLLRTVRGNIIADSDRAQGALSESGRSFENGHKMTKKKNIEVSRGTTRDPAEQAIAESSQGSEIVRLLLVRTYLSDYIIYLQLFNIKCKKTKYCKTTHYRSQLGTVTIAKQPHTRKRGTPPHMN